MDRPSERGVPTWKGESTSFEEYKERARWYEAGLSSRDVGVAVARLATGLTGQPWKLVQKLNPAARAELTRGGVERFLDFIRENLIETGIPEAGRRFHEYLGRFGRKASELMKTYVQNQQILQGKMEEAMD